MKIIALMPVKNEAWILKTTLPQLKHFVDDIVALDGESKDDTQALIEEFGGTVIPQGNPKVDYAGWRQRLLAEARKRKATHQVWLDADEAFTTNFQTTFRNRLEQMRPGQKLSLDWLCLWKNPRQMRSDNSIWSHNP